jgi:hypothetical protein
MDPQVLDDPVQLQQPAVGSGRTQVLKDLLI